VLGFGRGDHDGVGIGDPDGCGLGDQDALGTGVQQPRRKWCLRLCAGARQYAAILLAPPAAFSSLLRAAACWAAVPCLFAHQ
jgi:hypothetical protein